MLLKYFLIGFCGALQVLEARRELGKDGLHRELRTNVTVRFDSEAERDGSLVLAHKVGKNTYVYLEELQMLDGFDFYPTHPMDIEKPASVSKDQLFMWRLPLNSARKHGHIKAYE